MMYALTAAVTGGAPLGTKGAPAGRRMRAVRCPLSARHAQSFAPVLGNGSDAAAVIVAQRRHLTVSRAGPGNVEGGNEITTGSTDGDAAPSMTSEQEDIGAARSAVRKGGGARRADSTDAISSFLTRRFGIAGGLAWLGVLTFGVLSEQLKTRREVREAAEGTKDVTTTVEVVNPSGLRYTDLRVGGGEQPKAGYLLAAEVVATVESTGQVVLDTRKARRQLVFTFGRSQGPISRGVMEGVASMRQGGIRVMVVPPDLGFGSEGAVLAEGTVPPGATVRFEIELARVSIPPS